MYYVCTCILCSKDKNVMRINFTSVINVSNVGIFNIKR